MMIKKFHCSSCNTLVISENYKDYEYVPEHGMRCSICKQTSIVYVMFLDFDKNEILGWRKYAKNN
jgi:predicted RNA-binding Zn-ribbon protein involved in translation (DUF1610 family)